MDAACAGTNLQRLRSAVHSAMRQARRLGRYLREADPSEIADAAAELEQLGFGAIWVPGGVEPKSP